eukprot:Rhum_TRINITY_DN8791_c0_g1::Rhum_TRINITY_DN8791_c0_g1_i1::g.29888::m.29888
MGPAASPQCTWLPRFLESSAGRGSDPAASSPTTLQRLSKEPVKASRRRPRGVDTVKLVSLLPLPAELTTHSVDMCRKGGRGAWGHCVRSLVPRRGVRVAVCNMHAAIRVKTLGGDLTFLLCQIAFFFKPLFYFLHKQDESRSTWL